MFKTSGTVWWNPPNGSTLYWRRLLEWDQVRWPFRRHLLADQWRHKDGPPSRQWKNRIEFRGDFYTFCVENSCQRRDKPLPVKGVAAGGRGWRGCLLRRQHPSSWRGVVFRRVDEQRVSPGRGQQMFTLAVSVSWDGHGTLNECSVRLSTWQRCFRGSWRNVNERGQAGPEGVQQCRPRWADDGLHVRLGCLLVSTRPAR